MVLLAVRAVRQRWFPLVQRAVVVCCLIRPGSLTLCQDEGVDASPIQVGARPQSDTPAQDDIQSLSAICLGRRRSSQNVRMTRTKLLPGKIPPLRSG